jgi:uncharacterized membrane protein YkvA (DUF1232 family)
MKEFIRNNKLILLSLAYVVFPFDIIPEALIGPLGLIEDFGLVISLLVYEILSNWKNNKNPQ